MRCSSIRVDGEHRRTAASVATAVAATVVLATGPTVRAEPAAAVRPAASAPANSSTANPPTHSSASATRVIEDDQVRIEETRIRGQVRRIVVAPKGPTGQAAAAYEISVGAGGRDPSQDHSSAGQRVWSLFRF